MECSYGDGKPVHASGLCKMHYARKLRYGGAGPPGQIGRWSPIEVRFANNVNLYGEPPRWNPQLGACHLWTGVIHRKTGYGTIGFDGRKVYAHRLAWWLAYGEWPRRLDHLCPNRHCVRIDHLREARKSPRP